MTYDEAATALQGSLPEMTKRELRDFTRDFVETHMENLTDYHDYDEEFSEFIEAGLLPKDKYALLHDDSEKYLHLWDLDYILEYIEYEEEIARALQERKQPDSRFARLWSRVKTAFRRCRT